MKQLITGGARSGKSALAEQLAQDSDKTVIYIATTSSDMNDDEMAQRIQRHQQQRPNDWRTIETPIHLSKTLTQYATEDTCLLIDCLTLWLSNCILHDDENMWQQQKKMLLNIFKDLPGDIIVVGNEVGSGIIPLGKINRLFVDENGWLNQDIATDCDRVILTAAGLPMVLKGDPLNNALSGQEQTAKQS